MHLEDTDEVSSGWTPGQDTVVKALQQTGIGSAAELGNSVTAITCTCRLLFAPFTTVRVRFCALPLTLLLTSC